MQHTSCHKRNLKTIIVGSKLRRRIVSKIRTEQIQIKFCAKPLIKIRKNAIMHVGSKNIT